MKELSTARCSKLLPFGDILFTPDDKFGVPMTAMAKPNPSRGRYRTSRLNQLPW